MEGAARDSLQRLLPRWTLRLGGSATAWLPVLVPLTCQVGPRHMGHSVSIAATAVGACAQGRWGDMWEPKSYKGPWGAAGGPGSFLVLLLSAPTCPAQGLPGSHLVGGEGGPRSGGSWENLLHLRAPQAVSAGPPRMSFKSPLFLCSLYSPPEQGGSGHCFSCCQGNRQLRLPVVGARGLAVLGTNVTQEPSGQIGKDGAAPLPLWPLPPRPSGCLTPTDGPRSSQRWVAHQVGEC